MNTLIPSVPVGPPGGVPGKYLLSLLCAVALMGCDSDTAVEPEMTPSFAMAAGAPVHQVSGGGTLETPNGRSLYTFHASVNGAGAVKGQFELHFTSADVSVHGDVTCLVVDGNDAWLGAVVTRSNLEAGFFAVGGDFSWRAQDNGEAANAEPDRVSRFRGRLSADDCNTKWTPLLPLNEWPIGNVQIR